MRKLIILLLCCGLIISMVGYGGNTAPPPAESPPTTVLKTIITETPTETTAPVTAVEPTEEEKEPLPTEKQGSDNRADCGHHRANDTGKANGRSQTYGNNKTDRVIGGGKH